MLLNRRRAERVMEEKGLEGLIATSPANILYSSDLCPYGETYVLLPLDGDVEPAVVTSISALTPVIVMSRPWIRDIRYFGEFYTETRGAKGGLDEAERGFIEAQGAWEATGKRDPITLLLAVMEERGLTDGRVGVDESALPPSHAFWRRLREELPRVEAVPASHLFTRIRMIKTEEEIRRVGEAVRITERAWEAALDAAREGMTERAFAYIYEKTILEEGGRPTSHMGVYGAPIAFGRRTAFVDIALPSGYRLRRGDLIRFDGGCSYRGYRCDMARTAVLGEASGKQERYHRALLEGARLAVEMARPGAAASDIFSAVVRRVREEGIPHYRRHHVGHGWGLEGYDPPLVGPGDETRLEEGMLLCLETPYYEIGFGGLMVEDVVVVRRGRARRLTRLSGRLRALRPSS
ncbi:MAG: M24 family metallopeptidase [Candidatus Bathyarchaeia archaeon]